MTLVYAMVIAGLSGLAAGSFLNVCVSRWPDEKSVIKPGSHCQSCQRPLSWWENVPLLSWLALRGRCRTCHAGIGLRHPVVELAVGALWTFTVWHTLTSTDQGSFVALSYTAILDGIALMIFEWLLVGLAAFDAECLWLPDKLIFPGVLLGLLLSLAHPALDTYYYSGDFADWKHRTGVSIARWFLGVVIATGLMLVIRYAYRLIRSKDGMGAGDVKLMAMLGGWLGASDLKLALLAFAIGVLTAMAYALILVAIPAMRGGSKSWLEEKLPFGTFLCVGGIVVGLWGMPMLGVYMTWAGSQ